MGKIKIAKYLAECGIASRRKSEALILTGKVKVNGTIMLNIAERIDPQKDTIEALGQQIKPAKNVYYLLYKPIGYTSTTKDPHAEKLITELVPKKPKVYPVGRLDKYTSGLIILTNDGELTQKLTHPKYEKQKEYSIKTNYPLTSTEINQIKKGVKLEDGLIKPDLFEKTEDAYKLVIHSGRKRIVRRLINHFGKKVSQLKRTRLGKLTLGNLKPGEYRALKKEEISNL